MSLALEIAVTAALVVGAGVALARFGDDIGLQLGIGRLWIGSVLIAGATSLPELTTDVAAVRIGAVDLAAGDLIGSSMANMFILAVLDLHPRVQVLRRAALDHALSAALAIMLTALAALFLLTRIDLSWGAVGVGSMSLLALYLLGARAVFTHTARVAAAEVLAGGSAPRGAIPWRLLLRSIFGFAAAALVIIFAAPRFAHSANALAEVTGLGETFVGTTLVGLSTSLPELVASVTAIRMKAFDLAVANLFGSNALNMAMFIALDLASEAGPIFAVVSPSHALSALVATAMMATGIAAIVLRARRRFAIEEPSSALMVLLYGAGLWILHRAATPP
jgi:cation:H+ antiporter